MLKLSKKLLQHNKQSRLLANRLERRNHQCFPFASNSFAHANQQLVSVVIPVYNHADFISDCLSSVLEQTEISLECIVINDGSTDNLEQIIKPFLADKRLRYYSKKNEGIASALNLGFEKANGEFLSWFSADNTYQPGSLKLLRNYLISNPSVVLSYANVQLIDQNSKALVNSNYRPQNQAYPGSDLLLLPTEGSTLWQRADNFINCAFMYRAETAKAISGYRSDLLGAEDYQYWLELSRFGEVAHVDSEQVAANYRVHKDSLSEEINSSSLVKLTQTIQNREALLRESFSDLSLSGPETIKEILELADCKIKTISSPEVSSTEKLELRADLFFKSKALEISDPQANTKLTLPPIIEIPEQLKSSRSSYYQSSKDLGEKIALVFCDKESDLEQTLEVISKLTKESRALGFILLSSEPKIREKLEKVSKSEKNLRFFYSDKQKLEEYQDTLLFSLSSVDFILDIKGSLVQTALAAVAAIPIFSGRSNSASSNLGPVAPHAITIDLDTVDLDTVGLNSLAQKLEEVGETSLSSCEQWLKCFSQEAIKDKLIAYLKSSI